MNCAVPGRLEGVQSTWSVPVAGANMSEHEVNKDPSGSSQDDRAASVQAPSGRQSIGLLAAGIVLVGTAIIAALVDFFARMTNESDRERGREEQARREFMATGRWPRRRR